MLALATSAAHAQQVGETVAVLELAAPTAVEFILRGTIPVPHDTFPRADGRSPFQLRNHDGTLSPAQVERVSGYSNESRGADVVEVLARVRRSTALAAGAYTRFDVVFAPHADGPPHPTPDVDNLRFTPQSIVLRARDVFGHVYQSDLRAGALGRKTLKQGSSLLQERCYDLLRPLQPQSGPQATLPRLLGVHAYLSYWSDEDTLQLDLRVHNATSGSDRSAGALLDDVQNEIYFDQLELIVPPGWNVQPDFPDPSVGALTVLPDGRVMILLVKALPGGKLHVIGKLAQFERRVAIFRPGQAPRAKELVEERFLGFCRAGTNASGAPLWSWWNPATARYFPQRHRLPDLSYVNGNTGLNTARGKLRTDHDTLLGHFSAGTAMPQYPLHFPRLGWAHPWGVAYGGMTGGTEVTLYDGVITTFAGSHEGYRATVLRHRMYTDRMNDAMFELDGEPTSVFRWLVQGPGFQYIPGNFYQIQVTGPDMLGWGQAPTHQVTYARQNGFAPPYESQLLSFKPIDLQHLGRYLNAPKVMAWLGNDSVAKDDIRMQAEIARMSYYHTPNSANGAVLGSSMLGDLNFVGANPGKGFAFGRGEGWMIDAMCATYSLGDSQWRLAAREWFERITHLVFEGRVQCTGMIQAIVSSKILNGQYRARQAIEQAIVENALWSMRESVFRGGDWVRMGMLQRILVRSAYAMVGFPAWTPSLNGPFNQVAIGPLNLSQPMFCGSLPPGGGAGGVDKHQSWSSFAYAYQMTGDTLFLQRAMQLSGPQYTTLQAAVQQGYFSNIENRAALISLQNIQYP